MWSVVNSLTLSTSHPSPVKLTCISLDCEWKPEDPCTHRRNTQTPHRKSSAGILTRNLLSVRWQCYTPALPCYSCCVHVKASSLKVFIDLLWPFWNYGTWLTCWCSFLALVYHLVTANSKGKISRSKVENEQYIRLSRAWGPRTHVLDKHFLGLSCAGRPRMVTDQGYALCLCPGFPGTADLENVSRHGGLAAPGAHHTPAADEASSRELLRRVAELPLMLDRCMRNRWRKWKDEHTETCFII